MKIVNALIGVLMMVTMALPSVHVASAQPEEVAFDLANVPIPVEMLPEEGYQVLTGGFLDQKLTTHWIASPRNGGTVLVDHVLTENGWLATYILDLVLLEDRAFSSSQILSLVQTNVYLFADERGAAEAAESLRDFSTTSSAEEVEPVIRNSTTVRLTSESGDTYRSIVQRGRTILEIVTLESLGYVDIDTHRWVVADSTSRLETLEAGEDATIATRSLLIEDGDRVADLFNAQQTGVHQVYRVRDNAVQPAAGEIDVPTTNEIAPQLVELYQVGQVVNMGQGNGFYSGWIGRFASIEDAASFVTGLPQNEDSALLPDPYFTAWRDESSVNQGVPGLYRVSGTSDNGAFSGTLEIQQRGPYVVGIGWRTWGSGLPSVDVTSRLMNAQLVCIEAVSACAAMPLDDLLPPDMATPLAPSTMTPGLVTSPAFGWSLAIDSDMWTITGQFAEDGYDFVELQSGRSLVTLESIVDQRGDPEQCVMNELHALQELEFHAVIELGSDDPDDISAGLEPEHGWAVYTVEPLAEVRMDQEYTVRIDCYTLVEGGASLVLTHRAPRYVWDVERGKGIELRDALTLPE